MFDRGQDFAASIWVIDPVFMLDLVHEQLGEKTDEAPAAEHAYFAGAKLSDEELRAAAAEDQKRRQAERQRQADAERSNLGLGHDINARLMDPTGDQLDALRRIVCHLIADHHREVIAYGAGWSDRERQQPVGDSGHYEPRHIDAIVAAELQRALDELDPLRGIAQLTARWGAAFVLNPDGVTRTKALGRERIARKLADALPGGENPLRTTVWEFMRPILSPNLAQLNRDAFVLDEPQQSTVRLEEHRGDSDLAELDRGDHDEQDPVPAQPPTRCRLPFRPRSQSVGRKGTATPRGTLFCPERLSSTFGSQERSARAANFAFRNRRAADAARTGRSPGRRLLHQPSVSEA